MITFIATLFQRSKLVPDWAPVYDGSWCDKLYRGIKRNHSGPFRVVVLCDDPALYRFAEPVEAVPLLRSDEGWMNLQEMYRPDLPCGRRVLLGLDTVIMGDIDDICYTTAPFATTRNHHIDHAGEPSNAIVVCDEVVARWMWERWDTNRVHWRHVSRMPYHPDMPSEMQFLVQAWPELAAMGARFLTDDFPGKILSYSQEWLPMVSGRKLRPYTITDNTAGGIDPRVVYFHGATKPDRIARDAVWQAWL